MAASPRRSPEYISLIGDIVGSRQIPGGQRARLQQRFQALIGNLNAKYRQYLASQFIITLGDEFQGLLSKAAPIPDIVWDLEEELQDREFRLGFGIGVLYTPLQEYAINLDGPTLHNARAAIDVAKSGLELGGVFRGFGKLDTILDGIARMLWFHRSRLTRQQRRIVHLLRQGMTHTQIAGRLRVSRQAISKQAQASGWGPYAAAETSWRALLQAYVEPMLE
ncbi:MAG TPA: SatD family protein [Stellaceae bacterium]|nr:SatD family protein [Stellaceae bacterium]